MRKLPGDDSIFLSAESSTSHLHTGAVVILDPSEAPDFSLEKLRRTLDERIDRVPKLRWRLRPVPLGLDSPYWEESTHCNVDEQLHRVCLPAPGTEVELAKIVGELLSRQLDRNLPLWEVWYIEGLERGRVALLLKMHHALFDGISGAGLGEVLADIEPNPPAAEHKPRQPEIDHGRNYSDLELYARGLISLCGVPYRAGREITKFGWKGLGRWRRLRNHRDLQINTPTPRASFNGHISASRDVTFTEVPLQTIKAIKNFHGVTVNDVVLALCGSAIRRYLLAQGELPPEPIVSWVPMSTRQAGDRSLDNKVGTIAVSLETHLDDPVARLLSIHKGASNAKALAKKLGPTNVQALGTALPPIALQAISWVISSAKVEELMPPIANTVISNVQGPQFPLYMCGAVVEKLVPIGPIMLGMGVNMTVLSYVDHIAFGIMMDPHLVPEPWYLCDGIALGLQELESTLTDKGAPPDLKSGEPKSKDPKSKAPKGKANRSRKTATRTAAATKIHELQPQEPTSAEPDSEPAET